MLNLPVGSALELDATRPRVEVLRPQGARLLGLTSSVLAETFQVEPQEQVEHRPVEVLGDDDIPYATAEMLQEQAPDIGRRDQKKRSQPQLSLCPAVGGK